MPVVSIVRNFTNEQVMGMMPAYVEAGDLATLKKIVAETVKIYNTERPNFSCSLLTPSQMHKQNQVAMKTYKTKKPKQGAPCFGLNSHFQSLKPVSFI